MKNLKKALSLVLASAMLFGMMVVGAGAAHSDVKDEHNVEAIAVVTAAGIMGAGDTFNPNGEITRGEMAVIMTNMLDLDVADFKGASNFTDAGWAVDYIDACYANGIMAGVSATEFGTNVKVTTAQAALMMLKALGYFEKAALNDWMLDTIKMASKINLLDGINAKASGVLTRNEVAQLALNALEATMVEETANGSNTSIKGEGFEITVDSTVAREDVKANTKNDKEISYVAAADGKLQLIESLFGARFEKTANGETDLGLPAIVWQDTKEKETIIKAAKEADEVLVADETTTAYAMYADEIDEDFKAADMNELAVAAGDVVYFYEQDDDTIKAYKVTYELAKVTKIDKDMTKAEIKEGYSFEVTLDGKTKIYDTDFAGFDYAKNDYILVVMNGEKTKVLASELAETVEGKITSMKSGKFYIDGTAYENLTEETLKVKDEISAILNKAGQIIKITEKNEAVKSSDFAYIYNTADVDGDINADGVKGAGDLKVYVVLADGTKAAYIVDADSVADIEVGKAVPYSINKDGEFEVEASELTAYDSKETKVVLNKDTKSFTNGSDKVYANSKTEFVFLSWKDNKLTTTTATGIKNVDINAAIDAIYDADDDEALVVFVAAKDEGIESDAKYAVMMDKSTEYTYTEDEDGNTYYTYNVVVDGEETTLTFEKAAGLNRGTIFAFIMDGDYAVVSAGENKLVDGKVSYEGEGFIEIGGKEFTVAANAELYNVIEVKDAKGATTGYEVSEADELVKDDVVKYIADKDDVITMAFIIEVDD